MYLNSIASDVDAYSIEAFGEPMEIDIDPFHSDFTQASYKKSKNKKKKKRLHSKERERDAYRRPNKMHGRGLKKQHERLGKSKSAEQRSISRRIHRQQRRHNKRDKRDKRAKDDNASKAKLLIGKKGSTRKRKAGRAVKRKAEPFDEQTPPPNKRARKSKAKTPQKYFTLKHYYRIESVETIGSKSRNTFGLLIGFRLKNFRDSPKFYSLLERIINRMQKRLLLDARKNGLKGPPRLLGVQIYGEYMESPFYIGMRPPAQNNPAAIAAEIQRLQRQSGKKLRLFDGKLYIKLHMVWGRHPNSRKIGTDKPLSIASFTKAVQRQTKHRARQWKRGKL